MEDKHKFIDDYLKGLLNDIEKANFELSLAKDKNLQEEVNFRKTIVHSFNLQQVKQTIEQAKFENEKEAETETKFENVTATIKQAQFENTVSRQKRIRMYRTLSMAATFLIVIGGGWFWSINQTNNFLTHILVSETDIQNVTTANIEKIKSLVEKANQAIKEKDFESALSITNQLRNEEGFETDEILQNECYIYFKQQNYTKANKQVDNIKDAQLKDEVRWQLSALYLDAGETDFAKQQLQSINEEPYKTKAIKKLKSKQK